MDPSFRDKYRNRCFRLSSGSGTRRNPVWRPSFPGMCHSHLHCQSSWSCTRNSLWSDPSCRGKLRSLLLPYLITGVPALLFATAGVAMIEMLHHEGEAFHFLGLPLDSANLLHWLLCAVVATFAYLGCKRTLPQLQEAWESANAIDEADEERERS